MKLTKLNTLLAAGTIALMTSCSLTTPVTATNNEIGTKEGRSSTIILGGTAGYGQLGYGAFVTNKNYGVIEAAKKGGIDKIGTVDVKVTSYIIFKKVELIVSGE